MKKLFYFYIIYVIGIILGSISPQIVMGVEGVVQCNNSSLKVFEKRVADKKIKNLVFFSSWCGSCKTHLLKADLDSTIFIVAFDREDMAVSALNSLFPLPLRTKIQCELDLAEEILKFYKVKSLPYQLSLIEKSETKYWEKK